MKEVPDLPPELGQIAVLIGGKIVGTRHIYIVSRYKWSCSLYTAHESGDNIENAVMTLASGIEVPAARIAEICKRSGIQELSIFGSAARGDMRADSDLDVMVESFPEVVHGWEYFRLERELADVFGRPVDLATKKWMKPRVKARVLPEAASFMRRDSERIADIVEACALIADYLESRRWHPWTPTFWYGLNRSVQMVH